MHIIKETIKKIFFKNHRRQSDNNLFTYSLNKFIRFVIGQFFMCAILKKIGIYKFLHLKKSQVSSERELIVLSIVKNEGFYIKEWIDFHLLIGVDKFIIYDNGSTDDTKTILQPYIDSKIVRYIYLPGESQQVPAYRDAIKNQLKVSAWVITIDVDEFLVPVSQVTLKDFLKTVPNSVSQIMIGWMVYGSNNLICRPKGLVIENFSRHAKNDYIADYKSIIKSERFIDVLNAHMYLVAGKTVDENMHRIWSYPYSEMIGSRPASKRIFRINHYYTKSLEEYELKIKRGDAYNSKINLKSMAEFHMQDKNELTDNLMRPYIKELKNIEK
ncbi:hypothetical protein ATX59_07495 [Oenococcus oeni]|uniref:Glycosyltransferase family 2 protein n=1 Tax=Oenococcus oeni TaxID=1247 RepID=A0A6N4A5R1_OENOE|nr:hypothetical protein ATX59_07495 [Oenococcus oeni]